MKNKEKTLVGKRTVIRSIARNPNAAFPGALFLGILLLGALFLGTLFVGAPSFVVLAAAATPPNLANTLEAQRQLVAERPYDAEAHNDHGNLLVLAGRHDEAGDAYRRAIELAPEGTLARYNLGVLMQQDGRYKQAQEEFQSLLEIDSRHARAHYQLGMLFHSRKQRTKAVEHYARAFAYDPDLTFAKNNPHIIDNPLATEALLVSQIYGDAPSSDMARLYGEPARIVELMLAETEEPTPIGSDLNPTGEPEVDDEDDEEGAPKGAVHFGAAEDEDDEDDEDDSGSERENRRALTREDLDTASSVGRVQEQPSRRQPARRSSAGRDRSSQVHGGFPAVRPPSLKDTSAGTPSTQGGTGASGSAGASDGRRYRPTSRSSTGRLELKLLAPDSPAQRDAATATR